MKILVTGSAGFIGFHLVKSLVKRGGEVIGIDNINEYYDVNLKYDRLAETGIDKSGISYGTVVSSFKYANYKFIKLDLADLDEMKLMFEKYKFDVVCNLAAQAGVRYSLENPSAYIESNIKGFLNILECCRNQHIGHLIYASSSSVYGLNEAMPFSVDDNVDHPVSLYAASKKSNELMAHAYSYLFGLPTTALRFFTVYGPWGRPDMALFLFSKAILENKPIRIFNNGLMKRDFTYIDDIIQGILKVIDKSPCGNPAWDGLNPDPSSSKAPYRILNIGRGHSVKLLDFISAIERHLGVTAKRTYCPLQEGDVIDTWADISKIKEEFSYVPQVGIEEGIAEFLNWYKVYYSYCNQEAVV